MKKHHLALALLALIGACSKAPASDVSKNTRVEQKNVDTSKVKGSELARIREEIPVQTLQVWLKKDFWLGRTIWVSMGIERASVTGLAMSVDGYHAAKLSQAGNSLVLTRDNTGLFGGSVLGPDLPLNAYPIVKETKTEILVDLAAPKTPYGLTLSNFNEGTYSDTELAPRFEYVKSVETTENALNFTSVSTTRSPIPLFETEDGTAEVLAGQDPFLLSMTIRTDWIIPTENEGFIKKIADDATFGFFLTPRRVIDGGAATQALVQKIATNKPFTWELSANTPEEYRSAIEQGILAWNPSLGGEVLKVTYATAADAVTKTNVSNLVWDDNMAVGFAFANWRSNPATGEIVQAQVYMSGSMWAASAKTTFQLRDIERQVRESSLAARSSKPGTPQRREAVAALNKARAKLRKIAKETSKLAKGSAFNKRLFVGLNSALSAARARSNEFCFRPMDSKRELLALVSSIDAELDEALKDLDKETVPDRQQDVISSEHDFATHMPYPAEGVTMEDFSKMVVRAVIMHEVGHTIGLRHNFMGSLGTSKGGDIQSTSIMDYNDEVIDAQFSEPGSYDQAIVASEYKNEPIVEELAFCTDEHAILGIPTCAPFDFSADPIRGQQVAEESSLAVAQLFIQYGQAEIAISLLEHALGSNIQKIRHALFPADIAAQMLGDPTFGDSQKAAWKMLGESMAMQDLGFSTDIVKEYKGIIISYLSLLAGPEAATSAVAGDIANFFKEVAVSPGESDNSLAVRRAAIVGLQNFQSAAGRLALTQALEALNIKIEQSGLEILPEDQETLLAIKNILERDGYYKVVLN